MLKVILERKTDFIIRLISQNYTVNVFCQQSFTFFCRQLRSENLIVKIIQTGLAPIIL